MLSLAFDPRAHALIFIPKLAKRGAREDGVVTATLVLTFTLAKSFANDP